MFYVKYLPPLPKIVPFMRYVEKYGAVKQATWDNIVHRMRNTCLETKDTDTRSEYTFPRQQWLRERASILRLYVHCLACLL